MYNKEYLLYTHFVRLATIFSAPNFELRNSRGTKKIIYIYNIKYNKRKNQNNFI